MDQRYLIDYKCYKHFSRDGQKAGPNNWVEFIKRNLTPHPFIAWQFTNADVGC